MHEEDLGIQLNFIPAGTFQMGDFTGNGRGDEKPVHTVTLNDFYLSGTPITFNRYDRYCCETGAEKPRDWGWGRNNRQVIDVNWFDAVKFCDWLSEKTGRIFRLPTEAEWEYAARSGGKNEQWAGTDDENLVDQYAWYFGNSGDEIIRGDFDSNVILRNRNRTHPVGAKLPNGLGLYDMSGNVTEWCSDLYKVDYYENSKVRNPQGPKEGELCVTRGGCWANLKDAISTHHRNVIKPSESNFCTGFRIAEIRQAVN